MLMNDYLNEIAFAVNSLMPAIWGERGSLDALRTDLDRLARVVAENYRRAEAIRMNAEDPEEVAMAAGVHWDNYFGEDKERFQKSEERQRLEDQIEAHAFSVGSLSAALLQYAKQGISLVHGGLTACPNGRTIGTQSLKSVVWQARNQAIHWEEGNARPAVQQVFNSMTQEVDAKFAEFQGRNMAYDVVELLGWKTLDEFRADMLALS
jgi:hypothetical protein